MRLIKLELNNIKSYQQESFTINFIDVLIGKFKIKELEILGEE